MRRTLRAGAFTRLLGDDSGQVLPMVTIMLIVLLGLVGLTLDVGRAYYAQRELQASCDAAALAAAQDMLKPGETPVKVVGPSGVGGVAGAYSSVTGGSNARSTLPSVTELATLKCYATLQAQGQPCVGTVPYNAVQVQETAVLPTVIAWMFGKPNMPINALATASARGGTPKPSNIAVIVDTTLSEDAQDANCQDANGKTLTEMQCSLNGFQVLLSSLQPCGNNNSTCAPSPNGPTPNSFDRVALFTFPNVTPATVQIDTNCTTTVPTPTTSNGYWTTTVAGSLINYVMPYSNPSGAFAATPYGGLATAAGYTFPFAGATSYSASNTALGIYTPSNPTYIQYGLATYQVTDYLNDYRLSNTSATLNMNSALVIASGAKTGCGGLEPSNFDGVYGTYYAGVIYAAQASLVAQQAANPGSQNVIILISDGDSTSGQSLNSSGGVLTGPNNGPFPAMPSSNVPNPATSNGLYPSWNQECSQAVTAAQYATSQGTTVFSVAYGSEPVGCKSDINPVISPCDTMAAIASAPQFFYSDYLQSGSASNCVAGQPVVSIAGIFASIADDLTEARLIPNNTQ